MHIICSENRRRAIKTSNPIRNPVLLIFPRTVLVLAPTVSNASCNSLLPIYT